MRKTSVLSMILMVLLTLHCASGGVWQPRARAGVAALIESWDLTMTTLGTLYKAGKLGATPETNEGNKALAIMWGERARLSLKAAAAAIDASDAKTYDAQIAQVGAAIQALTQLLKGASPLADIDTGNSRGSREIRADNRSGGQGLRESAWYFGRTVAGHPHEARQDQRQVFRKMI